MNDLSIINNNSVAIQKLNKKLTDGETALLALIKRKIKMKSVLTINDFVKIYKKHVLRRKDKSDSVYENGEWKYIIRPYYDHEIEAQAKQWFISSL